MGNHVVMLNLKSSKFIRKNGSSYSCVANSVIVVTGASSGIGREITYKYAERGARIVIGSRSIDVLEEVTNLDFNPNR